MLLLDLARAGLLRRAHAGGEATWLWRGKHPRVDRALLALLARFDLHLEVGLAEDETVWIAAAIQERAPADAQQAFSGTGFRPEEAIRTCLGEFAEFQSWLYRPGDTGKHGDQRAVGSKAIDPWDVLGFAPTQRDGWQAFNATWQGYDRIPAPDAFDGEIAWTEATRLGDQSVFWVPSQLCFGRYGAQAVCADSGWRADTNGCAAGPTRMSALAHALLELVERDATGVWWYGRARRPSVSHAHVDALGRALSARAHMGQTVQLLDLTHDLEIPVVAAILADAGGNLLAIGFGCNFDPLRAIRAAYREMCQMELSITFAMRRVAQGGMAAQPEDRRLLDWLSAAGKLPHLLPDEAQVAHRSAAVMCDEERVVALVHERLRRAGLQACIVDLERPDIGVPAVRAFAPGLAHYKPRLGYKRLTDAPRALHWHDESFGPRNLSDLPLLI